MTVTSTAVVLCEALTSKVPDSRHWKQKYAASSCTIWKKTPKKEDCKIRIECNCLENWERRTQANTVQHSWSFKVSTLQCVRWDCAEVPTQHITTAEVACQQLGLAAFPRNKHRHQWSAAALAGTAAQPKALLQDCRPRFPGPIGHAQQGAINLARHAYVLASQVLLPRHCARGTSSAKGSELVVFSWHLPH